METSYYITIIGYVAISYFFIKFFNFAWTMFRCYFLTFLGFVKDLHKYGEWVVITGATDGIGKRQLAQQGFKIVLISRNKTKLGTVAEEIRNECGVEVKIICFDFTQISGYDKIEDVLSKLDVGILVNNVGMSSGPVLKPFHITDVNQMDDTLHCNMFSDVQMTHMVLKGMVSRKRGAIIHISSASIFVDIPYITIYPSTKVFMEKFFKSLSIEYAGIIDHQLVTPAYVATNLSRKKPAFTIPSAEEYVKTAIRTIGLMDDTCGYFTHELQRVVFLALPQRILLFFVHKMILSKRLKKD